MGIVWLLASISLLGLLFGSFFGDQSEPDEEPDPDEDIERGTDGSDDVFLGDEPNSYAAGDGDDSVSGEGGDDNIWGENGNDVLWGDQGRDLLVGNAGQDLLFGDAHDDGLFGGPGNDTLLGGGGADLLLGGSGDDESFGDEGDDLLIAGNGYDILYGGADNDVLDGGGLFNRNLTAEDYKLVQTSNPGDVVAWDDFYLTSSDSDATGDDIYGGMGDDLLLLGRNDWAWGGEGADAFLVGPWIEPGNSPTVYDFEPGVDVIVIGYEGTPPPLALNGGTVVNADTGLVYINVDGVTLRPEDVFLDEVRIGPAAPAA